MPINVKLLFSGEAVYCDDIPHFENELHLALVLSTKAHARIVNINTSQLENLEGIRGFFSSKDLPNERNSLGAITKDDRIFAPGKVSI